MKLFGFGKALVAVAAASLSLLAINQGAKALEQDPPIKFSAAAVTAPVNSAPPVITGTLSVGSNLSVDRGTWDVTPTSTTYKWYRCFLPTQAGSSQSTSNCALIAGATTATYKLVELDGTKFISASVTAFNGTASATVYSATTSAIPTAPKLVTAPVISGVRAIGSTLSVNEGSVVASPAATSTYQWYRCTVATPAAGTKATIPCLTLDATDSTYTQTSDDLGKFITVASIKTNDFGRIAIWSQATTVTGQLPTVVSAPTVTGSPVQDGTLTLNKGTWAGSPVPTFVYSWYRCTVTDPILVNGLISDSTCQVIAGAAAATYKMTAVDLEKYVFGVVKATNSLGITYATANDAGQTKGLPKLVTAPVISGTKTVGSTLTLSAGNYSGFPVPDTTYRWFQCSAAVPAVASTLPNTCRAIDAYTDTYVPNAADAGKFVTAVTYKSNDVGTLATASISTAAITMVPVATTQPSVTGTPLVDSTLTLNKGVWAGFPVPTFTQAWYRCMDGSPTLTSNGVPDGCNLIAGATAATYKVTTADLAAYVFGVVKATNSLGSGYAAASPSSFSKSVPKLVTAPVISGLRVVGSTLTVNDGSFSAFPAADTENQWYRCGVATAVGGLKVTAPCEAISGQTRTSYTLTSTDLGRFITVTTKKTNSVGSITVWSQALLSTGQLPTVSVDPTVGGAAVQDATLTVNKGTWLGLPAPSYSYSWYRCDVTDPTLTNGVPTDSSCVSISGATAATYKPVAADLGHYIFAVVKATNTFGSTYKTAQTVETVSANPRLVTAPIVSGDRTFGATLTASAGAFTGSPTPQATRQWYRCQTAIAAPASSLPAGCATISSATAENYTLVAADAGKFVTVATTMRNTGGSLTIWSASAASTTKAPAVLNTPAITGSSAYGGKLTLTNGIWDGFPVPTFKYSWYRCPTETPEVFLGVPSVLSGCSIVAGAITNSYTVGALDVGSYVFGVVKATNTVGSTSQISTSAGGSNSAPRMITAPVVTGERVTGSRLTVDAGVIAAYPPVDRTTYQWFRCTSPISVALTAVPSCQSIAGATRNYYSQAAADQGKYVTVATTKVNTQGTLVVTSAVTATTALAVGGMVVAPSIVDAPPTKGTILQADPGDWSVFPNTPSTTYQWYTCDSQILNPSNTLPAGCSLIDPVTQVSAGMDHTCDLLASGVINCWGKNDDGQLGNGTADLARTSVKVSGITSATSVSAGYNHTCAVLSDRTIKCWGDNTYGQLGVNSGISGSYTPVSVYGITNAVSVSLGNNYSCATLSDNTIKCWGDNSYGQLGDGTTTSRRLPVLVSVISSVQKLATGNGTSCAVLADATVKCWGNNSDGQFGNNTLISRPTPVSVAGIAGATSVSLGTRHACATLSTGALKCWGNNSSGQLGDNTRLSRILPVTVAGITGATSISASATHTCATLNDGTMKCWGDNGYGQLGNTTTTEKLVPTLVANTNNALVVATGDTHSCAILRSGSVQCWGFNGFGQIGDDTVEDHLSPMPVDFGDTRTLSILQLRKFVTFSVTVSDNVQAFTKWAASTTAVSATPEISTAPSVTGERLVGKTLTVNDGVVVAFPVADSEFQWYRCDAAQAENSFAVFEAPANCAAIEGATDRTYALVAADAGKFITVASTKSNTYGEVTAWAVSAVATLQKPVPSTGPSLTGSGFNLGSVLTLNRGTWNSYPVASLSHKWYRCPANVAITLGDGPVPSTCTWLSAFTANTYQVAAADLGFYIVAEVTADAGNAGTTKYTTIPTVLSGAAPSLLGTVPTVTGARNQNQTLTVANFPLGPIFPAATFSYQWYRCTQAIAASTQANAASANTANRAVCSPIAAANGNSYLQGLDDSNKFVTVATTASNSAGDLVIWAAVSAITTEPVTNVTAPVMSGTRTYGSPLTLSDGTWRGAAPPVLTYSWFSCQTASPTFAAGLPTGCTAITSATSRTFTPTIAELGTYVFGAVKATNSTNSIAVTAFNDQLIWARPTVVVSPVVSGTRTNGSTLTLIQATYAAYPAASTSYQWYACTSAINSYRLSVPSDCMPIEGATSATYVQQISDLGKFVTLGTTKTNDYGVLVTLAPVAAATGQLPSVSTVPELSGTAFYDSDLTLTSGLWSAFPPASNSYSWYRCSTANPALNSSGLPSGCTLITSGSSPTYKLAAADVGKFVLGVVTGTNASGAVNAAPVASGIIESAVIYTGIRPTVSGSYVVGGTLVVQHPDVFVAYPAATITYKWFSCTDSTLLSCDAIDGATERSYVLTSADIGRFVTAATYGTNQNGTMGVISAAPYSTDRQPSITGTATPGQMLTADPGTYSDVPSATYSYKWYTCDSPVTGTPSQLPSSCGPEIAATAIGGGSTSAHTCAVVLGGYLACWGANNYGQLGNGNYTNSNSPILLSSLVNVKAVATSSTSTCALITNGTVQCWGAGGLGQLGRGSTLDSTTPVTVSGISTATAIAAGSRAFCALLADGTVKCWGYQAYGQVNGSGITGSVTTPTLVSGINGATGISMGDLHSCALLADGTVKCWGSNGQGQFGNGTTKLAGSAPTLVSGLTNATAITSSNAGNCALLLGGSIKCWGYNASGQAGNGTTTTSLTATVVTAISSATAVSIAATAYGNCAILSDATVKCWGSNLNSELGTAGAISGAVSISAGSNNVCVILRSGAVRCWGLGTSGQLGNAANTTSAAPVEVWFPRFVTGIPDKSSPTNDQLGKYKLFEVKATNGTKTVTRWSGTSAAVSSVAIAQTSPSVAGTRMVGSVLTSTDGTYLAYPAISATTYQWYRCVEAVTSATVIANVTCDAIDSATSATYTQVAADAGKFVTLAVTKVNPIGSVKFYADASQYTNQPPVLLTAPTISGVAQNGSTLTVSNGAWSGAPAPNYSYSWYRCSTSQPTITAGVPFGCSVIAGAIANSYVQSIADAGLYLFSVVSAANQHATANATAATLGRVLTSPYFAQAPLISGSRVVSGVLTISTAGLTVVPAATATAYQWYRCVSAVATLTDQGSANSGCVAIDGATTATYTLADADAGKYVTVKMAVTNDLGTTSAWAAAPSLTLKAPTFGSFYARTTGFDVNWTGLSNVSYVFNVTNSAGAQVATYSCAAGACPSTFTIAGLPVLTTAVSYNLNWTANTPGVTLSGTTTTTTYPKMTLGVSVSSITQTGSQYAIYFQPIAGWTYKFTNYNAYDNSNCGIVGTPVTTSPMLMWLPRGLCTVEFVITDGHGNSNYAAVQSYTFTKLPTPEPVLTGSLNRTSSSTVDYSMTYSAYIMYYYYNVVILNSSGAMVTPAIVPSATRVGDQWSGTKYGTINTLGFAPGTYTVRGDFAYTNDVRYSTGYASVTLGTFVVE